MIETGVFLFSILSAGLCFPVIRKYDHLEKFELATYFLLFGWGSFLFGLSLPRLTKVIGLAGLFR